MRRAATQEAERRAMAFRAALGYGGLAPLPARRLAGHLGYQVTRPNAIAGIPDEAAEWLCCPDCGWSALVLTGGGLRLIVYNPSESAARQESSLMHELAHLVCGHPSTSLDLGRGLMLRAFHADHEEEAAWMGGCLQLPRDVLRLALRQGMTLERIAAHFTASMQMVSFRYRMTGLARQLKAVR